VLNHLDLLNPRVTENTSQLLAHDLYQHALFAAAVELA